MEQRQNIEAAFVEACASIGATVKFVGIDTAECLKGDFKWKDQEQAKQILDKLVNDTDVLIDLTLFGLDELPSTKAPHQCLRKEVLAKNKEIRGADLHMVSESSFVKGGSMCADYQKLEKKVRSLAKRIKNASRICISVENGGSIDTDIVIEGIDPKKVFMATGMLQERKINPSIDQSDEFRNWHFLPSGAVFLALESSYRLALAAREQTGAERRRQDSASVGIQHPGRITFNGPTFGFGSFKKYPLVVEIGKDGRIESEFSLSEEAPYFSLVKRMFEEYEEAREIGELFIGLNPRAAVSKRDPMEFQVAEGNVSLAIGRNDHMRGSISPSHPSRSLHIHASIPGATVCVDNEDIIKKGVLQDFLNMEET
jgi:hypothetical protein